MEKKMSAALEFYDALRSIGIEEPRARSAAEKLDSALDGRIAREISGLVTTEIFTKEIAAVRNDMTKLEGNLRQEIGVLRADVRTDIARLEAHLIRWMVGTLITATGLAVAIAKLIG
jgi:hypothetical protein